MELTSINKFLDFIIRHARPFQSSKTYLLFEAPLVDIVRIERIDVNEGVQLAVPDSEIAAHEHR